MNKKEVINHIIFTIIIVIYISYIVAINESSSSPVGIACYWETVGHDGCELDT